MSRAARTNSAAFRRRPARAFTLAEVLVVISIIAILLAVSVPAFSNMLYSTDRSNAENQLRVGLGAARDAAVRSGQFAGAGDAAAVFMYDPATQRLRIVPCVKVGVMIDEDMGRVRVERDVFVPAPDVMPVELPRGWTVRAYTPRGTIDDGRSNPSGWYDSGNYRPNTGNWVFPETGFYDAGRGDGGVARQTFMVRFEAGTGSLDVGHRGEALVVDLAEDATFRSTTPWTNFRLDRTRDLPSSVRRLLVARSDLSDANRRRIIGDLATDSVLAKPVTDLALYDERRLAGGIGARGVNVATGCLYGDPLARGVIPTAPTIDTSLHPSGDPLAISDAVNAWFEGRGTRDSDARLFTMDRYSGQAREILP